MGLKIFDRLWVQASEDIKDVNALLTDFKKADYDSELAQITNELIILESKEKNLKSQEENIKTEIKEYQEKIEKETKKLRPVDQSIRDIEVLKDEPDLLIADAGPLVRIEIVKRLSVEDDLPLGRGEHSSQHREERGFATAARPDQRHEIASVNGQRRLPQRVNHLLPAMVLLVD